MKFKVWDKTEKKWCSGWYFLRDDGVLCGYDCCGYVEPESNNKIPVFSTGKTDKNGVELYSGDCIDLCQKEFPGMHHVKEILFVEEAWRTRDKSQKDARLGLLPLLSDFVRLDYIKIGTKFENPELLETTK